MSRASLHADIAGCHDRVLAAMGVLSHGNVRISLHRDSTSEQVDRFLAELPDMVAELRKQAGVEDL